MSRRVLSQADRDEIFRRAALKESYAQIAKDFGISRNGVSGIVYRHRHGWESKPRRTRVLKRPVEAFHLYRNVEPSKRPYAPDDSCPDFANDDQHVQAVKSARPAGFPVAQRRAS